MKVFALSIFIFTSFVLNGQVSTASSTTDYLALSVDFIELLKDGNDVSAIIQKLKSSTEDDIDAQLDTDHKKLAFWVNVYNGNIQYILQNNPDLYKDRSAFFANKQIDIAGRKMSFADIEHGIIRHSAIELLLGFFTNPFAPGWERTLRVEDKDWRIHFALNCGAKDCPPVAVYHADQLDYEFDFMTTKYLNETTTYKEEEQRAYVVSLFSWFRGDFGGMSGIRDILVEYDIVPVRPVNVRVTEYDWTLDLGNYREIEAKK